MTHYLFNGNAVQITRDDSIDIRNVLPGGTYAVKFDQKTGAFYLERINDFRLPVKLYGDVEKRARRVWQTFQDRSSSTGVLLTGDKGSGKTLLAKHLSMMGRFHEVPTLVVNQAFVGDEFNDFIQQIEQQAIVLFDEFEKVYDDEKQEQMLTLLDGVYDSKKLFILTCNDNWRIDKHMRNRPGRLYYRFDYKGIDASFVREYADDNVIDASQIEPLIRAVGLFPTFNFDMLQAVVEEMNRYDESPVDVLKVLNARPEAGAQVSFNVTLFDKKGTKFGVIKGWKGNPLGAKRPDWDEDEDSLEAGVHELVFETDKDYEGPLETSSNRFDRDTKRVYAKVTIKPEFLASANAEKGEYTFALEDGSKIIFKKNAESSLNWSAVS